LVKNREQTQYRIKDTDMEETGTDVWSGPGAHPASCPMGIGGPFPVGKAAGAWSWPLAAI